MGCGEEVCIVDIVILGCGGVERRGIDDRCFVGKRGCNAK